jgi:hypothetical protein
MLERPAIEDDRLPEDGDVRNAKKLGRRKVQHHARARSAPRDQQLGRQEGRQRGVQGAAQAH